MQIVKNHDIFFVLLSLKLLWLEAYHSTDFEVHRNWLALTSSLHYSKWYYFDGSEWTLDYPPFFAFFEYSLAIIAEMIDPLIVQIHNLGYNSRSSMVFQRLSVITSELVLYYGLTLLDQNGAFIVVFANPVLLMVDHIHFQYNGFLFGIQLIGFYFFKRSNYLMGAILFAALLNFKHIYLYQALSYFVYILSAYVLTPNLSLFRLIKVGAVVVLVFAASFGPFYSHLPQIFDRLFPFGRGLLHAYWAPNIWALYAFTDRLLVKVLRVQATSLTRGVIGDTTFNVLPQVTPLITLLMTLGLQLPLLFRLFKRPTYRHFIETTMMTAFVAFMVGFHVHEKAILMVLIPLALLPFDMGSSGKFGSKTVMVFSICSLFPLIYEKEQWLIKFLLASIFLVYHEIPSLIIIGLWMWGSLMTFIHLYDSTLFLPLMLNSVLCSSGMLAGFTLLYYQLLNT